MRIPRCLAILCGVLALASCGEASIGPISAVEPTRSINGFYAIESLTVSGKQLDVNGGRPVTLNLNAVDRTDMTGTGPCNDFFGSWSHTSGRLVITGWQTTDLDCPNEQAIEVERALFEALRQGLDAVVDSDQTPARLVMVGDDTSSIVWTEVSPPETQPIRPRPFVGTTTSMPGETDPGEIEASR